MASINQHVEGGTIKIVFFGRAKKEIMEV
jgi:hypothetical protein